MLQPRLFTARLISSASKVKLTTRQPEKKPRDLVFKRRINQATTVLQQHKTCKALHIKMDAAQNGTAETSCGKTERFPESDKRGTRQWREMINQQLKKKVWTSLRKAKGSLGGNPTTLDRHQQQKNYKQHTHTLLARRHNALSKWQLMLQTICYASQHITNMTPRHHF